MASEGIHGHGTTLTGTAAGLIGHITSIGLDGLEIDDLDISTMDSEEKWREFIGGMKNAGSLTLELVYVKANMTTVLSVLGVSDSWTIVLPDNSTFVCDGYLKANGLPISFEEDITQSITLKLSGKPEFTAGS